MVIVKYVVLYMLYAVIYTCAWAQNGLAFSFI